MCRAEGARRLQSTLCDSQGPSGAAALRPLLLALGPCELTLQPPSAQRAEALEPAHAEPTLAGVIAFLPIMQGAQTRQDSRLRLFGCNAQHVFQRALAGLVPAGRQPCGQTQ